MRSLLNRKMGLFINTESDSRKNIFVIDRQRNFKSCDLRWVWNYFHKTLSISCKAKISKHVQWWTALVSCARGQKLVRYYLIYDHEFKSLILPRLKYQSILHVRKWTALLSWACGQKTCQIPHCICYRYSNSKIVVILLHTKGQLISKGLFAILEFFQKTNETIQS